MEDLINTLYDGCEAWFYDVCPYELGEENSPCENCTKFEVEE